MILAEKVRVKDRDWIKVSFHPNPQIEEEMKKVRGVLYNPRSKLWAVPYQYRKDFEEKMEDFLIIWKDEDGNYREVGGIDENTIPDQPIVPGYSVEYDENKNIVGATGFKIPPWGEFQVKGFNLLVQRPFLILGDDPGLGKTFQVITAIEAKKKLGMLQRGIIICKATLLYTWLKEIHKHTYQKAVVIAGNQQQRNSIYNELRYNQDWTFAIISYETFRMDYNDLLLLHKMVGLDFCVLDEAHKVKNPQSKIGSVIFSIPFKYRYVLTATPLPNSPLEAYNYLKWGGKIKQNWWAFRKRYAIFGGYNNKEIVGYKNIKELRKLIQNNMLRRLKKDKLKELPDIVFKTITVEMSPQQKLLYNGVKNEILEILKDTSLTKIPSALTKLLRLQQITDSPTLIGAPAESKSAKLEALDELLEDIIDNNGQKAIVFSRFLPMVHLLTERYKRYNPAVIHGDVNANGKTKQTALKLLLEMYPDYHTFPPEKQEELLKDIMTSDRQKQVDKFQNDSSCKLFIGCTPACREGLTLTAATYVIFLDCEWSYDYVEQAFSRAHRIGQKNAVTVYYLVCQDTIDEHVMEVIQKKKAMSDFLLKTKNRNEAMRAKEFIESMI
ncbi:hypothetical protein E308F_30820 [Moorella sp. E308F]|uniref:DEAD/DEAH box helicase n=1 Tax=Moorella sp. E308F TaxID=2572682 RepID=UPI0010FFB5BD|nr:DEAD/DEAH box helicase [Moorella sp. E308F]GEA16836.1 hypothetical protein E308F_30820 [Moorella sp. E308F]